MNGPDNLERIYARRMLWGYAVLGGFSFGIPVLLLAVLFSFHNFPFTLVGFIAAAMVTTAIGALLGILASLWPLFGLWFCSLIMLPWWIQIVITILLGSSVGTAIALISGIVHLYNLNTSVGILGFLLWPLFFGAYTALICLIKPLGLKGKRA